MALFWFFVFDFEDNPTSFLKKEETDRKLQENHGMYNQMLLMDQ